MVAAPASPQGFGEKTPVDVRALAINLMGSDGTSGVRALDGVMETAVVLPPAVDEQVVVDQAAGAVPDFAAIRKEYRTTTETPQ